MAGEYKEVPVLGMIPGVNFVYNLGSTAVEAIGNLFGGVGETFGKIFHGLQTGGLVGLIAGGLQAATGNGSGDVVEDVVKAAGAGAMIGGAGMGVLGLGETAVKTGGDLFGGLGTSVAGAYQKEVKPTVQDLPFVGGSSDSAKGRA